MKKNSMILIVIFLLLSCNDNLNSPKTGNGILDKKYTTLTISTGGVVVSTWSSIMFYNLDTKETHYTDYGGGEEMNLNFSFISNKSVDDKLPGNTIFLRRYIEVDSLTYTDYSCKLVLDEKNQLIDTLIYKNYDVFNKYLPPSFNTDSSRSEYWQITLVNIPYVFDNEIRINLTKDDLEKSLNNTVYSFYEHKKLNNQVFDKQTHGDSISSITESAYINISIK